MNIVTQSRVHVLEDDFDRITMIKDTIKKYDQEYAFHLADIDDIINKYKNWIKQMPRVHPFYAVKCNDSSIVLAILAIYGTGFDCASQGEISKIQNLGVEPSRIIFANTNKPVSDIQYAQSNDVRMMTFDSESELYKIQKYYPNAKMVLRIRYDDIQAKNSLGKKFGCDPVVEGPTLLDLAYHMNIDVIGTAFHVGVGCCNPTIFYEAIRACRSLFDYTENNLDYKMNFLDIGGGYQGAEGTSINEIAYNVNKALDEFFPDPSVRVISEPGSYFVTSAFTLVCNIVTAKTFTEKFDKQHMYYINDGVYGSFCSLHKGDLDLQVTPKLLKKYSDPEYESSIWGPTCDSRDVVRKNIMLPKLAVGDWMYFDNMGAYSISVACNFSSIPLPDVYWVVGKQTWKNLLKEGILKL